MYSPLRDAQLIQGNRQLTLDFVVVGLQFGQGQRLFLDRLLEIDVGLVGGIQGHFQFGDLDLQLLLDAGDLALQSGLGLDDASVQLFDLDAGLFAGNKSKLKLLVWGFKTWLTNSKEDNNNLAHEDRVKNI